MGIRKAAVLVLLSAATCTQVGCLFGSSSHTTQRGNVVAVSTFNQIEPGKSSAAFAKGVLGNPDSSSKLEDGSEIWRWTYTERKEDAGYIFLIFGGSDVKELKKSAFVQVKDGVVVKTWRE